MTERVQKILSQWGIASRRQAEKIILAGRVKLNGQIVQLGDKADLAIDKLEVDGKEIKTQNRPQLVYLLLNKPGNVVSTCYDPQNRTTVLDLLPDKLKEGKGIHPVGRLDFESTGALLLTNDGELTLSLTHPRYHLPKTYRVWLDNCPNQNDLTRWRKGIMISGRKTLPAQVKVIKHHRKHTLIEVILTEGRNRQIRRVAEQLGFKVLELHRTSIGSISLQFADGSLLPSGHYRYLQPTEISLLKNKFNSKSLKLAALN
ncbi:MAG: pseudouridine synthase [Xenococcaceae cyanobacterium MO_188.B32]|nr:pseudouridine synthase [Xenococcaceae cyanobacterium MO_188.B32]